MHSIRYLALLAGLSLVNGLPSQTTDGSPSVVKRQDPAQTIAACIDDECTDCPYTYKTGSGYPECNVYSVTDLESAGFNVTSNAEVQVYFNVPTLDAGCKVIIQTPVTQSNETCGGNVLVAESATCAPVLLEQTLIIEFCCGTGDCGAAGAPGKRDMSANPALTHGLTSSRQPMFLEHRNGTTIHPRPVAEVEAPVAEVAAPVKKVAAPAARRSKKERSLMKRDCNSFTVTNGPYTTAGDNFQISDEVTCGATSGCSATEDTSVTQTWSLSVSASVSDPFSIVSASVSVGWSESIERSFSATYMFGAGETGYVDFIPILTCVDGYFTGDCSDNGVANTACGPTKTAGEMSGDIRGVVVET